MTEGAIKVTFILRSVHAHEFSTGIRETPEFLILIPRLNLVRIRGSLYPAVTTLAASMRAGNCNQLKTFRDALRTRDFVVSAEIFLRPEADLESIGAQCKLLRDCVDGVLLTDNQYGQLHLSPLAAASVVLANGVDPIVQIGCRNRNRISLVSDLLGAAVLGVTSVMLIRGEKVPDGFEPRPKAVMDVKAKELIAMAAAMNADEKLQSFTDVLVGGIVSPHEPKPGWVPKQLTEKIDAGAQFVHTHICLDTELLRGYVKHLVAANLVRRASIIVATAVISSANDARWLQERRPNVMIPDSVVDRLERAQDPQQEGIDICAEQLMEMQAIPGIAGAHILATGNLAAIASAVQAAGLKS